MRRQRALQKSTIRNQKSKIINLSASYTGFTSTSRLARKIKSMNKAHRLEVPLVTACRGEELVKRKD
jgi:hypothetical protein